MTDKTEVLGHRATATSSQLLNKVRGHTTVLHKSADLTANRSRVIHNNQAAVTGFLFGFNPSEVTVTGLML